MYIVVADDDIDDKELFKEAIEHRADDVELVMVSNGEQLMQLLNFNKRVPDIIFLDLNMPYKPGKECLVEIKNCFRFHLIPVVIFSTSSSSKEIEVVFRLGADLYIIKPSSFVDLKRILELVLNYKGRVPNSVTKETKHVFLPY